MAKVTIYSTPTCVYCKMAKEFFREHDITFEEKHVAEDRAALEEMINKSGQTGVPVIDIDGQIVIGFDRPTIAELLKIQE